MLSIISCAYQPSVCFFGGNDYSSSLLILKIGLLVYCRAVRLLFIFWNYILIQFIIRKYFLHFCGLDFQFFDSVLLTCKIWCCQSVPLIMSANWDRKRSILIPVPCSVGICLQCHRPGFNPWIGKIPWRRKRLPTPVFWPGEFHGLYSPCGHQELDTTEWLSLSLSSKFPRRVVLNVQTIGQLCLSHMIVKSCLKSCMLGFSIMPTKNFQTFRLGLEKTEEPEVKLPTFAGSYRKQGIPGKHLPLFHRLC